MGTIDVREMLIFVYPQLAVGGYLQLVTNRDKPDEGELLSRERFNTTEHAQNVMVFRKIQSLAITRPVRIKRAILECQHTLQQGIVDFYRNCLRDMISLARI